MITVNLVNRMKQHNIKKTPLVSPPPPYEKNEKSNKISTSIHVYQHRISFFQKEEFPTITQSSSFELVSNVQ